MISSTRPFAVIAVELIRTLLTHELTAILELFAFVVARKMLKPDLPTLDILLGAAAFAGLLAARRFFVPSLESEKKKQPKQVRSLEMSNAPLYLTAAGVSCAACLNATESW